MTPIAARRGFAAPLALCMLAAVAGLAAGSFHSIVHARRAAGRAWREQQAAAAADRAIRTTLESWDVPRYDSLFIGAFRMTPPTARSDELSEARGVVMRITERLFGVTGAGRAAVGTSVEAHRLQQLFVEVLRPAMPAAALTARGDVQVGPEADIVGEDRPPPGWADCPPPDTAGRPAVLVPEGVQVTRIGGGAAPSSAGDPVAGDPATYERLGRVRVAALASRAELVAPAGAILSPAPDLGRACRVHSNPSAGSWGEPLRTGESPTCERYHPVVVARGDLVVTDGRGQGVLLVNGRLRIRGPFLFAGLILAAGGLEVSGHDVRIYGAVLSGDPGGASWLGGELSRSSCALLRARDAAARPYVVPHRGWAEVY